MCQSTHSKQSKAQDLTRYETKTICIERFKISLLCSMGYTSSNKACANTVLTTTSSSEVQTMLKTSLTLCGGRHANILCSLIAHTIQRDKIEAYRWIVPYKKTKKTTAFQILIARSVAKRGVCEVMTVLLQCFTTSSLVYPEICQ